MNHEPASTLNQRISLPSHSISHTIIHNLGEEAERVEGEDTSVVDEMTYPPTHGDAFTNKVWFLLK